MRLLIYLLAMMTGFSAAEAARPVAATPAAVQGAVIAAAVASVDQELVPALSDKLPGLPRVADAPEEIVVAVVGSSPIIRHDITRQ